jgi:ABC-type Zn uptake system ZnuABC Zn-binding protein ZnuA
MPVWGMNHHRMPLVTGLLAIALVACQSPASSPSPGTTLKVLTTTTVFADIVQKVGGSRVTATSIIPPGVGPEDYEPKPDDAV